MWLVARRPFLRKGADVFALSITRLTWLPGLGLLVVVWHLAASAYNPLLLPSPSETFAELVTLAKDGDLARAARDTGGRALTGIGLAAVAGGALGLLAGHRLEAHMAVSPAVSALQVVPPIAWIVMTLIWFGTGGRAVTFTVAAVSLPMLYIAVVEGVRNCDRDLAEMARAFSAPPVARFRDLLVPQVGSYVFPALVSASGVAWKSAVMAEVLGADSGIGSGLTRARVNLNTPEVFAWVLAMVVIFLAFEYLVLRPLRARLEPWRPRDPAAPGVSRARAERIGG